MPLAKPFPSGRKKKLGMTGMDGAAGILKADWRASSYLHTAYAARIDDLIKGEKGPICMLKADVEGRLPPKVTNPSPNSNPNHKP